MALLMWTLPCVQYQQILFLIGIRFSYLVHQTTELGNPLHILYEAEFVAAYEAACELVWLCTLLAKLS